LYSVYQHWDPLRVCIVGKSYNPKFYDYIKNSNVRKVFYRIAEETEEDYQKLIRLLESFGVTILRPDISDTYQDYIHNGIILPPPMTPRDYSAMIGNNFYLDDARDLEEVWEELRGSDWPNLPDDFTDIPKWVIDECKNIQNFTISKDFAYYNIIDHLKKHSNIIFNKGINSAMTTRIGKDLYFGTTGPEDNIGEIKNNVNKMFGDYRCHVIETQGHSDGVYCPIVPGLIFSLKDIQTYEKTFPDWEVIYLQGESWEKVLNFLVLKQKNKGKWWVPGEEINNDFTDYVETWMNNWVGYVEETVFDVNMLVIDQKNVVCNGYNKKVFDAFDRYGITPHIVNFRHRYFWDGGLHCITSDVHREGAMQDYFPERG
jgi:glycine amidinotransferase